MNTAVERIRNEARSLPLDERELLLAAINYDLRGEPDQREQDSAADIEAAWDAEIAGRVRDVAEQRSQLIAGHDADLRMADFIASRRKPQAAAL